MCDRRKADHNSLELGGMNVGYLTVIERTDHRAGSVIMWRCRCNACGREDFLVRSYVLAKNGIKSCGCMTKNILSNCRTVHGMAHSPVWRTWKSMIERCRLESHNSYPDYGGRGIKVCDSWMSFESFYKDMGNRPIGSTLDRIDTNGNYEPSNCRWATFKQQANNRRNSRLITFNGETKTLMQWAEHFEIKFCTLYKRIEKGWSIDKALTTPVIKRSFGEECRVARYELKVN